MFGYTRPSHFRVHWIALFGILAALFLFWPAIIAAQDNDREQNAQAEMEQALKEAQEELAKALGEAGVGFNEAAKVIEETMKNIDFVKTMEAAMKVAEQAMKMADIEFSQIMQEMERAMAGFREGGTSGQLDQLLGALSSGGLGAPDTPPRPQPPSTGFAPFAPKIDSLLGDFKGEIVSVTHEHQITILDGTPVMLESVFTDVTVMPSSIATHLFIHVEITGGGPNQTEAQRMADNLTLVVEETPERVNVIIRQKEQVEQNVSQDRPSRFNSAKLHLLVPNTSPLHLTNSFGAVHVVDRQGGTTCKNSFGPMLLNNTLGELSAHNEYGPLNIRGHKGAASIVSKFGPLNLEQIDGAYSVSTAYGDASIKELAPNLTLTGTFNFGNAHVHLPQDYAGHIGAEVSMGGIHAPSELTVKEEGMFNRTLQAHLNDGDGRLQLNGSFGSIHLHVDTQREDGIGEE